MRSKHVNERAWWEALRSGFPGDDADLRTALDRAHECLAVYGSLMPGGPNHGVLQGLAGRWSQGTVLGRLRAEGWGAGIGYPALEPGPAGDPVPVWVLESEGLPTRWAELDRFEGEEYRRVLVPVRLPDACLLVANLYALRVMPP